MMTHGLKALLTIVWLGLAPLGASAQQSIPEISTNELKALHDAKADFLLINALSPIEFAEESITGSINIPYSALKKGSVKLPADKGKKLVFYCKGPK